MQRGVESEGDLSDIIRLSNWDRLSKDISKIVGLSLLLFDSKGRLLSDPANDNPICRLIEATQEGMQICKANCGKNINLSLSANETIFFKCPANLHVFSLPIEINGIKMVIVGGKTFFSFQEISELRGLCQRLNIDPETLIPSAKDLVFHDIQFLRSSAKFIGTLAYYLFDGVYYKERFHDKSVQLMTILNVISDLEFVTDEDQIYRKLINAFGIIFNIDSASIMIKDNNDELFKTKEAFGKTANLISSFSSDTSKGIFSRVADEKRPVLCNITFEILQAGLPVEIRSVCLFPLLRKEDTDKLLGIFCVFNTDLNEENIDMISIFCNQAAIILENLILRKKNRRYLEEISVFADISRSAGSTLEADEVCLKILEKTTDLLLAEQGSLMLLDTDKMELAVKAVRGIDKKIVNLLRIRPGEGIAGKVFVDGNPILVRDIESDHRVQRSKRPRYKTKSFMSIPLKLEDRTIGILNIADKITGDVFSEEDLRCLMSVASYASVAIERSEFFMRFEELKKISITDPLTTLLNRRYFQERLHEEVERSKRHGLPLSLIMIDIDHFKSFNDRYGHPAGDEALKLAAACMRNTIRTIDVAARYGGEEFTVILPQTTKSSAQAIADRICRDVEKIDFAFVREKDRGSITVSIGLASFPEDADTLEDLIRNSDRALYLAKEHGRNRVVLFNREVL
jgi:diguanylate cyclase (GGDEF)-like protein